MSREPGDDIVPLFDEYAAGFSTCNKNNQVMNGKTWPYRYSTDAPAANDYLFISVLMNSYHIWQDVGEDRNEFSFSEFCKMLVTEMIQTIRN